MPSAPPQRAPTKAELLADPVVQQALAAAWKDSGAGDPVRRHEEGGWIYLDLMSGAITVRGAPAGSRAGISLANPPLLAGCVVVGTFHTHPNPTAEGWHPGPSPQDERGAAFI